MNGLQSPTLQIVELAGAGGYGNNGSVGPASNRVDLTPTNSGIVVSFRPSLYVNL